MNKVKKPEKKGKKDILEAIMTSIVSTVLFGVILYILLDKELLQIFIKLIDETSKMQVIMFALPIIFVLRLLISLAEMVIKKNR